MNPMQDMMQRGLDRIQSLSRIRGHRGIFWRMCQCGREFYAIGRKRRAERMRAEGHVVRCREKARRAAHG